MTQLNNIFIGNKVVKQAFLNDALIYQSNGWEPTPSTMQQVWSREFSEITGSYTKHPILKVDSKNNIIAMMPNVIFKLNVDGNLLWKRYFPDESVFSMEVGDNDCIYYGQKEQNTLVKLNPEGKEIKRIDLSVYKSKITWIENISFDGKYLYILGTTPYILKVDTGNDNVIEVYDAIPPLVQNTSASFREIDFDAHNSRYIYVTFSSPPGNSNRAFRVVKNNLHSCCVLAVGSAVPLSIKSDSLGNAIVGVNEDIYKYKNDSTGQTQNSLWGKYPNYGDGSSSWPAYIEQLAIDSQDNIYFWNSNRLGKMSSDGTQLWKGNNETISSGNSVYFNAAIVVDHHDNLILFKYPNKVVKYISLVQSKK